jgi:hypothetical protein
MRDAYLQSIGAVLTDDQKRVMNDFVLRGRARIKDLETLEAVEAVLALISKANRDSNYLPVPQFDKLCAVYLVKRCWSAMWCGGVASGKLLARTVLPVADISVPVVLRAFNAVVRG